MAMANFIFRLSDTGVGSKLDRLSALDAQDILTATVNEIAKKAKAATPVGETRGLVNSIRQRIDGSRGVVGYTAEYAPHVEYGHRQNVGQYVPRLGKRLKASWVPGQHFFRRVVESERRAFKRRVKEAVEEAMR